MALNRIEAMLDFLNAQPNAKEGFSAKTMYETGMKFGLTCKEVKDNLLGSHRALERGKYPAEVPNEVLEAALVAPTPKVKPAKAPKAAKPATAKKTRNKSTAVVAKTEAKDEKVLADRRELIKQIAERNKAEDAVIADLTKGTGEKETTQDHDTIAELEKLMSASTVNPLHA